MINENETLCPCGGRMITETVPTKPDDFETSWVTITHCERWLEQYHDEQAAERNWDMHHSRSEEYASQAEIDLTGEKT